VLSVLDVSHWKPLAPFQVQDSICRASRVAVFTGLVLSARSSPVSGTSSCSELFVDNAVGLKISLSFGLNAG
jgi:hypothetical protein